MQPLLEKANEPATAAQPNSMQGMIAEIMKAVQGGGGATQDSELAQLGKDAIKSQIAMSSAITQAVVSRITGKAVIEVAEKLASA